MAGYLSASQMLGGVGFPLDDAWIHQTYARSLVRLGQWAFVPGQPSAGSTSPLWAVLESPGVLLGIAPWAWSAILGMAGLGLTAWGGVKWLTAEPGRPAWWIWAAGLGVVFEWHLVWASLSGMETLLLAGGALAMLLGMQKQPERGLLWGGLVGLTVWIRPDGLTLGLAYAWLVLLGERPETWVRRLATFAIGVALLAGPYLIFNTLLAGQVWPNTFYAKQAEYAVLSHTPLLRRLANEFVQPLIGPGAVLLPGLVLWGVSRARARRWADLAPLAWATIYLAAYALRLPVTYQHGRYAMPTIPVLMVLGMLGTLEWIDLSSRETLRRGVSRSWLLTWGVESR